MFSNEKVLNIEPVRYRTMTENIVENLRDSIIFGEIEQGTRITETELAEMMGVSRNVIREAILILSNEGLIVKERNKFSKVIKFEKRDVENIFELRRAVEKAAVKRFVESPFLCDELAKYAADIEKNIVNKDSKYSGLIRTDIDFHSYIVEAADNRWLSDTWNRIIGPVRLLLYAHMNDDQATKSSHSGLVEVFRSGDYRKACQALDDHIQNTADVLIKRVE